MPVRCFFLWVKVLDIAGMGTNSEIVCGNTGSKQLFSQLYQAAFNAAADGAFVYAFASGNLGIVFLAEKVPINADSLLIQQVFRASYKMR